MWGYFSRCPRLLLRHRNLGQEGLTSRRKGYSSGGMGMRGRRRCCGLQEGPSAGLSLLAMYHMCATHSVESRRAWICQKTPLILWLWLCPFHQSLTTPLLSPLAQKWREVGESCSSIGREQMRNSKPTALAQPMLCSPSFQLLHRCHAHHHLLI